MCNNFGVVFSIIASKPLDISYSQFWGAHKARKENIQIDWNSYSTLYQLSPSTIEIRSGREDEQSNMFQVSCREI